MKTIAQNIRDMIVHSSLLSNFCTLYSKNHHFEKEWWCIVQAPVAAPISAAPVQAPVAAPILAAPVQAPAPENTPDVQLVGGAPDASPGVRAPLHILHHPECLEP